MSADEKAYIYEVELGGAIELTTDLSTISDPDMVAKIIWDELLMQYDDPTNMIEKFKLVDTHDL